MGRQPDAVVLTGVEHRPAVRRLLRKRKVPTVEIWDLADDPIDLAVGFDNVAAGACVADHLGEGRREASRRFSAAIRRGKRARRSAWRASRRAAGRCALRAPIVEPLARRHEPERGRGAASARLVGPGAGRRRAVLPQRRARDRGDDGSAAAIDRRARPHADRRLRRLRPRGPCHAAADDRAGAGLRDRPPRRAAAPRPRRRYAARRPGRGSLPSSSSLRESA